MVEIAVVGIVLQLFDLFLADGFQNVILGVRFSSPIACILWDSGKKMSLILSNISIKLLREVI